MMKGLWTRRPIERISPLFFFFYSSLEPVPRTANRAAHSRSYHATRNLGRLPGLNFSQLNSQRHRDMALCHGGDPTGFCPYFWKYSPNDGPDTNTPRMMCSVCRALSKLTARIYVCCLFVCFFGDWCYLTTHSLP